MAPEFALSEESIDDERHVVAVRGEIDLFTAPDLKSALGWRHRLGQTPHRRDLSKQTFLDSTALGVLVDDQAPARPRRRASRSQRHQNIAKRFEIPASSDPHHPPPTRDQVIAALDGNPQAA